MVINLLSLLLLLLWKGEAISSHPGSFLCHSEAQSAEESLAFFFCDCSEIRAPGDGTKEHYIPLLVI